MNVTFLQSAQGAGKSIFAGELPMMQKTGLKSAKEMEKRRQNAQSQIAFWEKQKESLKNLECGTTEAIAKKLERLHSYDSEIAAVKTQYNQEQMWHTMDKAQEVGEKIAEESEKFEPKTAEERREELVEEALGTDEHKSELEESVEEMQEEAAEQPEEMAGQKIDVFV